MRTKRRRPAYQPTVRDIRRACERIQQTWSEREKRKRAGKPEGPGWLPPMIEVESLLLEESKPAA